MFPPLGRQHWASQPEQAGSLENERSGVDRTVQEFATGFKNSVIESFLKNRCKDTKKNAGSL